MPKNSKQMLLFLAILLELFVLTNCAKIVGDITTPSPSNTLLPTLTLTSIPSKTLTTSPTLPPEQATARAMKETQVYIIDTEMPATLEAEGIFCKDGFFLEDHQSISRVSNDEWMIFTCSPVSEYIKDQWTPGIVDYTTRYTKVIKRDLSITWKIQYDVDEYLASYAIPHAVMRPYRWTADGKYAYLIPYNISTSLDGFQTSAYFGNGRSRKLYRLNLETGDFETILPASFDSFSLSPNDKFLIYLEPNEPRKIHILNMLTGVHNEIFLDEEIIVSGAFTWHPDSTKAAFALGYEKDVIERNGYFDDISASSVLILDIETMQTRTILYKDTRILIPGNYPCENDWLNNTLCLASISPENWGEKSYFVDIETGELSEP